MWGAFLSLKNIIDVAKWDFDVQKQEKTVYQRIKLDGGKGSIRLLRMLPGGIDETINCELVLGHCKSSTYEALSYITMSLKDK